MNRRHLLQSGLSLAAAGALAACGKPGAPAGGASLAGAGATFPAPLYAKWAEAYKAASGVIVNYQAIGSGGGIKQIKAGTVDFGGTDKPLKADELDAAGLYQFPVVMGGVVPVLNAPGIAPGQLKLTGAVLADIFLGTIKRWNAPQIAALNPGLKLPDLPITVVHRSDGSGTSFLFTTYLAGVSPAWASKVGASDSVQWPAGIGGKGNDGVAAFVKQTTGAIGYVEYAYAKQNGMAFAELQNAGGTAIAPSAASFAAAAAGADWDKAAGNYMLLVNQPGAGAWPITGVTFILIPKAPKDPAKAGAVLAFFDWAYRNGDGEAAPLDFVPLPSALKDRVRGQWAQIKGPDGKPAYSPKA
ncbi:MAG TPA: phosphate ABC transporter substrate-binding protein PstS [Caulobacteraceae bacterium]|nr:phosphate ABC transporter substrate-binding protein PstS [Caulobacteraceae bacterium]